MKLIQNKWKAWKRARAKKAREKYQAEYDSAYNAAESIYKSKGINGLVTYITNLEAEGHEHKGAVAYYVKIKNFHLKMDIGVIKHERS